MTLITVSTELTELANEFQQAYNLDINTTNEAIVHDALHAILGLSTSLEDEEVVLNVVNCLEGGEVNPRLLERVTTLLDILLISEYASEIITFLN